MLWQEYCHALAYVVHSIGIDWKGREVAQMWLDGRWTRARKLGNTYSHKLGNAYSCQYLSKWPNELASDSEGTERYLSCGYIHDHKHHRKGFVALDKEFCSSVTLRVVNVLPALHCCL